MIYSTIRMLQPSPRCARGQGERCLTRHQVDLPLGGSDASLAVIAVIAERLGQTRVATLGRRHFNVVRPAHNLAFGLIACSNPMRQGSSAVKLLIRRVGRGFDPYRRGRRSRDARSTS